MATEDASGQSPRELLTQKEYAERRGCSKQYVNQLVRMGKIQLVNGKIDPIATDKALGRTRDPSHITTIVKSQDTGPGQLQRDRPASEPEVAGSYYKARAAREHIRALREKSDFEKSLGRLVDAQEVQDASHEAGTLFRDAILNSVTDIAERLAVKLKVENDEAAAILREEFAQILVRLSRNLEQNRWQFGKGLSTDLGPPSEQ